MEPGIFAKTVAVSKEEPDPVLARHADHPKAENQVDYPADFSCVMRAFLKELK